MSVWNSLAHNPPVVLVLDEYEASNLHWLLRIAARGAAIIDGTDALPVSLNTGDWNGQLLGQLEEAMADWEKKKGHSIHHANGHYPDGVVSWESAKADPGQTW